MNEEFNKFIIHSKYFQAHNLCMAFLRNICQLKAVTKGWRPGISPGYYGHDPWPLSTSKRNSQMFNFLPTDCIYPGTWNRSKSLAATKQLWSTNECFLLYKFFKSQSIFFEQFHFQVSNLAFWLSLSILNLSTFLLCPAKTAQLLYHCLCEILRVKYMPYCSKLF